MRRLDLMIAVVGLGAGVLVGCNKPATPTAAETTSVNLDPRKINQGPRDYGRIEDCKTGGPESATPTKLYRIYIPADPNIPFNLRDPKIKKTVTPINENGLPNGQPQTAEEPIDVGNRKRTRFDIRTQVIEKTDAAWIEIILQDPALSFQDKYDRVWDPDPRPDGTSNMFCGLETTQSGSVRFKLHYPHAPGQKFTHGHPNIGLIVKDPTDPDHYELPIFVDPDLENEGIIIPPGGGGAAKK
jgi:hypothetical protein